MAYAQRTVWTVLVVTLLVACASTTANAPGERQKLAPVTIGSLSYFDDGTKYPPSSELPAKVARCEQGVATGCADAGHVVMYDLGVGLADQRRAMKFWERACDGDVGDACERLGYFNLMNDKNLALSFYRKGCNLKSAAACGWLKGLEEAEKQRNQMTASSAPTPAGTNPVKQTLTIERLSELHGALEKRATLTSYGDRAYLLLASTHGNCMVWTSTDGNAWKVRGSLEHCGFEVYVAAVGDTVLIDPERISKSQVIKLSDSGAASEPLTVSGRPLSHVVGDGTAFYATDEKHVYKSTDGAAWTMLGPDKPLPQGKSRIARLEVGLGAPLAFIEPPDGSRDMTTHVLMFGADKTWKEPLKGAHEIVCATHSMIVLDDGEKLYASPDAITWNSVDKPEKLLSTSTCAPSGDALIIGSVGVWKLQAQKLEALPSYKDREVWLTEWRGGVLAASFNDQSGSIDISPITF